MNNEVIKAMNKKENTTLKNIRKWWNKNGYKVMRVIFFPVWAVIWSKDKINTWLNNRQVWSEERANEVLSYFIPRRAEWDAEEKEFYYFNNGMGWGKLANKYLKLKDRRWWHNHSGFWGGKIRTYLIEKFELEGFEKIVGDTNDGWTEICFRMIEKRA